MDLHEAREEYLSHLVVERGSSFNTIDAYGRDLSRYIQYLETGGIHDVDDVSLHDVEGFVALLFSLDYASSSADRALMAVRSMHKYLVAEGLCERNPAREVMLPKRDSRLPEVLSIAQANNFKSAMTYEILLMVVLGGIGSITGSVIGSFLFVAASEWWLRGLDSGKFLGIEAPNIFRNGFRLVIFSVIIMIVVLFFRQGIMGEKELPDLFRKKKKTPVKEAES